MDARWLSKAERERAGGGSVRGLLVAHAKPPSLYTGLLGNSLSVTVVAALLRHAMAQPELCDLLLAPPKAGPEAAEVAKEADRA